MKKSIVAMSLVATIFCFTIVNANAEPEVQQSALEQAAINSVVRSIEQTTPSFDCGIVKGLEVAARLSPTMDYTILTQNLGDLTDSGAKDAFMIFQAKLVDIAREVLNASLTASNRATKVALQTIFYNVQNEVEWNIDPNSQNPRQGINNTSAAQQEMQQGLAALIPQVCPLGR